MNNIIIKLVHKHCSHWVVQGIYDLEDCSSCEVQFLHRGPCSFIVLTTGTYEGIVSIILLLECINGVLIFM
jgi:hypothetical protein